MPSFGKRSRERLNTCHPLLVQLCEEVVAHFDISVIEGARSKERQDDLFAQGWTKLRGGESKHNATNPETGEPESQAVDVVPYPFEPEDWEDTRKFYVMAGHFQAAAARLGIEIRWGGDWDGDGSFRDQTFHDLPHIELIRRFPDPL